MRYCCRQRMIESGVQRGLQFIVACIVAPLAGGWNWRGGHNIVVQHLATLQRDNLARYDKGWHLPVKPSQQPFPPRRHVYPKEDHAIRAEPLSDSHHTVVSNAPGEL